MRKQKRKRVRLEAKLKIGGNLDAIEIKKDNAFIDVNIPKNPFSECKSNNFQDIIGYLIADVQTYNKKNNTNFSYEINIKIMSK